MSTRKEAVWQQARAIFSQLSPAAIFLGATINILDAVSFGLLLFPSGGDNATFQNLQTQAVSLFIMSTIVSQVVLVSGGSRLPGVLGSMLADVLPFLRAGATAIQGKLGNEHTGILPTVIATYSLTSLLLGVLFIFLGALRCGKVVAYFPHTVLTGAIGAIGISLCLLGLEVTLPTSSDQLRLETAAHVLLNPQHLPLLAISLATALILILSTRIQIFVGRTNSLAGGAYFIPLYCLLIVVSFWAIVGLSGNGSPEARENLQAQGWLFPTGSEIAADRVPWDYWPLFNFSNVQWSAILSASDSIALLIIFGAIGLPIFVPVTALALKMPKYDMDYEFLGHGVSNLLAGAVGTVPNSMVYSSSRFFALAGGGRPEAVCVTLLTIGFWFGSSILLPYVPTILAATLVLFFGVELLIDAIWISGKYYLKSEWITAVATSILCSVLGFAPGIGVGLSIVVVLQFWWSLVDSLPHVIQPCVIDTSPINPTSTNLRTQNQPLQNTTGPNRSIIERSLSAYNDVQPIIIRFPGQVTFASRPKLEEAMDGNSKLCPYIIIHFCGSFGIDTSVAQFLKRKIQDISNQEASKNVVLCGVSQGSQLDLDLLRCGIKCRWGKNSLTYKKSETEDPLEVLAYKELTDALSYYQYINEHEQDIVSALKVIFHDSIVDELLSHLPSPGRPVSERLRAVGIRSRVVSAGETIACSEYPPQPIFIVLKGYIIIEDPHSSRRSHMKRRAYNHDTVRAAPQLLYQALKQCWKRFGSYEGDPRTNCSRQSVLLSPGDHFGLSTAGNKPNNPKCLYAETVCWILEVATGHSNQGLDWIREAVNTSKDE